jgi:exodeoxyribonuclease VII large subunit
MDDQDLTPSGVAAAVTHTLTRTFPDPIWVTGVVNGKKAAGRTGMVFFDLHDPDVDGPSNNQQAAQRPRLGVQVGSAAANTIRRAVTAAGTRIVDGSPVRCYGRLKLRPKTGSLYLDVLNVDAHYTAARDGAVRDRLIAELTQNGTLARQNSLPAPWPVQRIAVVTSVGSAAWWDFTDTLTRSRWTFEVLAFDAPVQGDGAPRRLADAIERAAAGTGRWRPDIICVIRGGGARGDLAAFDDIAVVQAIAASPVPVLTGIGHEIDTSICDLAAWAAHKTPTAVAATIIDETDQLWSRHLHTMQRITVTAQRTISRTTTTLAQQHGQVTRNADNVLRSARAHLDQNNQRICTAATSVVPTERRALTSLSERITVASARQLDDCRRTLDQRRQLLNAHDPARTLERGYAIVRTADGTRITATASAGTAVTIITAGATHDATITATRPTPPDTTNPLEADHV